VREDSFTIDKSFMLGLIPDDKFKRNAIGLVEAYNCKVGKVGIEEYEAITNPFIGLPTVTWPYPQVFKTWNGIYITTQTAIYKANSSYVCTSLISSLPAGNLWELADFMVFQVWTNGVCTVVRDTETGEFSMYPMSFPVETFCNYNGQLVAGNFGGDKENWVAWGGIGKVELDTLLSKEDRSNTTGFMPMNFSGEIYRVKKLGDKIMVYGAQGISAIKPGSVRPYETMAQFGREDIFNFGIAGKGCVAGDDKLHVFIDNQGYVHAMDATGKHSKLGYKNFISNLENEIVITMDELKGEYYISDGERCYLFSSGLSEVYQSPSGLVRQGSALYGVTYDSSDESAYITTNSFNNMTDSIKTVQTVEAMMSGTSLQGAIDYRFKPSEDFTRGMVKNLSRHGTFVPMISGVDLRLHLKASTYVDFSVDNAVIRFKLSDKRTIRGPYAQSADL